MLRTLLGVAVGFGAGMAAGLWLRRRQRAMLDARICDAVESVHGVVEAIDTMDVNGMIELALGSVWDRTCQLRDITPTEPDTMINATPHKIADMCRLTAAEALSRALSAVSLGSEVGTVRQ